MGAGNEKTPFFPTFLKSWLTLQSLAKRWPVVSHSILNQENSGSALANGHHSMNVILL